MDIDTQCYENYYDSTRCFDSRSVTGSERGKIRHGRHHDTETSDVGSIPSSDRHCLQRSQLTDSEGQPMWELNLNVPTPGPFRTRRSIMD